MTDDQPAPGGVVRVRLPLPEMLERLERALANGELSQDARPPELRAYLQAVGISCTATQSRALLQKLEPSASLEQPVPVTFGQRLAAARNEAGLSRRDVCASVDISESYLSYLESDKREPKPSTLVALAAAVGKEPDWLTRGADSQATRRVSDLTRFVEYALDRGDTSEAESFLNELLNEDVGRPLYRNERDRAMFLKCHCLFRRGEFAEAGEILGPLFRRCTTGDSEEPLLRVALGYMNALSDLPGHPRKAIADAIDVGRQALSVAERSVEWWRVAATITGLQMDLGHFSLAASQGETWLNELRQSGDGPDLSSAEAGLVWNLGLVDEELGRLDEALVKTERALELQDPKKFQVDDVRLKMRYSHILMLARPHRVAEAIRTLEDCRDSVQQIGLPLDRVEWAEERARAEMISGRVMEAEALLLPLLTSTDPKRPSEIYDVRTWLLLGDVRAWAGSGEAADEAYSAAVRVLRDLPASRVTARCWRDLGDRFDRLGHPATDVADAYARALDADELPARAGLPPQRPRIQPE